MSSSKPRSDLSIGVEISLIQTIIGATTIISAMLLFIGWLYHRAYFRVFGLKPEWLGYNLQDYILGARNVLIIGAAIIFCLIIAKLRFDFERREIRLAGVWLSIFAFSVLIIYLVYDMINFFAVRSPNIGTYRPLWVTIFSIAIFLAYSVSASTLFYRYLSGSNKYKVWAAYIVWSGYVSLAFLGMSLMANYMGYLEGIYDSSSASNRLPRVSMITRSEIGFDMKPDLISKDSSGLDIYTYYNLRLLAKDSDSLYVFRIGSPVYVVQSANIYTLMLGEQNLHQPANAVTQTPSSLP